MCRFDGIAGRLNTLYTESGLSNAEFAKLCRVSVSAMKNYLNGRLPQSDQLISICEACSVSADWLLCLSDVRQPSAEMRAVCEYTGLSEKAVEKIRCPEVGNPIGKVLSRMIETRRFYNLITTYKIFLTFLDRIKESDLDGRSPWQDLSDDHVTLGTNEAANHFKQEAITAMAHICEDNYTERVEMIIQDVPAPFEVSMSADGAVIQRLHDGEI